MTKMNVGTASAKMKCCCGFVTKMNVGMTSVQILLHGKNECWHGFSTRTNAGTTSFQKKKKKTLDATLLQRLLTWLRCKDSWDSCVEKQVLVHLSYQEKHAAKQKQAIKKTCQGKDSIARKKKKKKKKSWKHEEKAEDWACISVMKEGNGMPLYRKFLRQQTRKNEESQQTINGSTNRPMEKCCHQNVQSQTLQLYYTQNQRRLHLILKWTRIFSHEDRSWWLITNLMTSKSKLSSCPVRTATAKVDQKAISPTMTRGFHTRICANPDTISGN